MKGVEQALEMILNGRLTCPVCGVGWPVTKRTDLTILAQVFGDHIEQHKRISAARPKTTLDYKARTVSSGG